MWRDLFFNIWSDDLGTGWIVLIVGLFFLCLAIAIIVIARTKALNKKFGIKHYLFFVFASLIMYQIIPVGLNFATLSTKNHSKAVKLEEAAIKTAIIPYQKGAYYINMAIVYKFGNCPSQMMESYKKAYDYIKSYEYIVWLLVGMDAYSYGYYDEAIEISNHSGYRVVPKILLSSPDRVRLLVLPRSYIMKGDFKNALIFVDKAIKSKENFTNLALKAYILKQMGQKSEAKIFYEKAIKKCNGNSGSIKNVNKIFNDFIGEEKKSLEKRLSYKCEIVE